MRLLASIALAAVLAGLFSSPAEAAKRKKRKPADPRTASLGRTCTENANCAHKAQVCLRRSDANGKKLGTGICALPCAPFDIGMKRDDPPPEMKAGQVVSKPPPRCPKKFECRSAGAGVPIDLCVRE
jgi:hypothetical protein